MIRKKTRSIAWNASGFHSWHSRVLLLDRPDEIIGSGPGSSGSIAAAIKILEDAGAKRLSLLTKAETDALRRSMEEESRKTFEKFSRASRETWAKAHEIVLD